MPATPPTPFALSLSKGMLACLAAIGMNAANAADATPPFEDSIAQRMQACTGCHGVQGRATAGGYQPRLAGKPAGYLLHQLQNFQAGRRHYGPMTALVDPLSDDYLREIAAYFSALDVPYAAPARSTATAVSLQRGEQLVRHGDPSRGVPACNQCHGNTMMGVAPAIPGLLGLPHDYVISQLGAWRTGKRQAQSPDCMARVAQQLDPADIDAVSHWLAAQPVPPAAKPLAALPPGSKLPLACGGVAIEAAAAAPVASAASAATATAATATATATAAAAAGTAP